MTVLYTNIMVKGLYTYANVREINNPPSQKNSIKFIQITVIIPIGDANRWKNGKLQNADIAKNNDVIVRHFSIKSVTNIDTNSTSSSTSSILSEEVVTRNTDVGRTGFVTEPRLGYSCNVTVDGIQFRTVSVCRQCNSVRSWSWLQQVKPWAGLYCI